MFSIAIFLAAMGITLLEMSEATAVGIALYAESKKRAVFLAVILGVLVIFIPTAFIGKYIALLPIFYVRLISAVLLLYFGIRLIRSSRRSVKFSLGIKTPHKDEEDEHRDLMYTGFSVGTVEAFEAAIVLVALYPNGYLETITGLIIGAVLVVIAGFILHSQIRKVKQANMKIAVSSLLLTFSAFWFTEAFVTISDLYLVPLFIIFFAIVYVIAHWNLTIGNSRAQETEAK
ncbi:MAG: hypothetical protein M1327_03385 [Candidatus Thermoplasmatota archaeon]|nr:hypothetical protein [Candidatus Thermoplasmatota archaeon]